jgi:hypothetical protein
LEAGVLPPLDVIIKHIKTTFKSGGYTKPADFKITGEALMRSCEIFTSLNENKVYMVCSI